MSRKRGWRPLNLWRGTLVLGFAVLAAHDVAGLGGHAHDRLFDTWLYEGIELAAGIGCLWRGAVVQRERWAWVALGSALVLTTTGDILYDFAYGGSPPFPSAADAFYLAFYPVTYLGLVLLLRHRVSRFSASLWLDGVMAGAAAAAVGSSVILEVVVQSTHGRPLVVLTNIAYPLGDIVLLALVVFIFAVSSWRPGRTWSLIACALLLNALGDGIYLYQSAAGTYVEGTWLDTTWPASLILLAFAAWQAPARSRREVRLQQRALLGTPVVCGLFAVGVLVDASQQHVHPLAVAFAAATIALVLGRTALTFRENSQLLTHSQTESLTDALTGLGNRRKLLNDLVAHLDTATPDAPNLLVVFDLNGFKSYNDTFGHPAGDALLTRLGSKLAAAIAPDGTAYRMGGDEFCVIVPATETLLDQAARSLHDQGETFTISSAFGAVTLPQEASDPTAALHLADQRLYAHKDQLPSRRSGAHELLLRTLGEREPGLRVHVAGVATLAVAVGRRLGLDDARIDELKLAAELHDVGKLAIPDAVLQKPGPLDDDEWRMVRQHTLVGERILAGSPALTGVGLIVRSTHEHWDGTGYPDGLVGEAIPLAARVICACDAYSAITSDRPYGAARSAAEAMAELRRCAGSQFDPKVVDVLCALLEERVPDVASTARA